MSFLPAHPVYRESGVARLGSVPGGWKITRLRFVARFNPSKSETAGLLPETEVSFLPMEAIGEDGSVRLDATRALAAVEQGYTYFRDGDVVIAKITPCFENGKGALVSGLLGGIGFGTTELIVVRPHEGRAIGPYLHWLFVSPDFRNTATAAMYGAGGQKRVPDEFVRDFVVALPPPAEQSAIAAFLDRETGKIDALVAEQERLIALLKEKRQSVISQAVTKGLDPNAPMKDSGVEWLGEVPAHWEAGPLKRFWSVIDCKHITPEFVDDGIPLASIREVQSRFVDLSSAKFTTQTFYELMIEGGRKPMPGDLIFSRNATVGEVAQVAAWHDPFAMGQDVCLLSKRDAEASSDFLQTVMWSAVVTEQLAVLMIGSTFKRVNVEEIRNLAVPMPPASEQAHIASVLSQRIEEFHALTAEAERAITLLKERRAALISAAVTGKIDVRGLVPLAEVKVA